MAEQIVKEMDESIQRLGERMHYLSQQPAQHLKIVQKVINQPSSSSSLGVPSIESPPRQTVALG